MISGHNRLCESYSSQHDSAWDVMLLLRLGTPPARRQQSFTIRSAPPKPIGNTACSNAFQSLCSQHQDIRVSPAVSIGSMGVPQSPADYMSPAAPGEKVALVGSNLLLLLRLLHSIAVAE